MGVIVVGYVPKPEGRAALDSALEEARRRGGQLVLVSSRRDGSEPGIPDDVLSELKNAGVDHDVVRLEDRFDAAEDLLSVAEERDAELIVIGLRRRTPLGKLIMGSNAQRVLLDAHCPVLTVKAES